MTAVIIDTSEQAYRLDPALSQSDLNMFKVSPKKFYMVKYEGADGFDSSGFRMGSAFDVFFLTPDEFDEQYVVQPILEAPGSPQQHAFVELMLEGLDHTTAYKNCGYKINKKSETDIKKAGNDLYNSLAEYIGFFKGVNGRIIITQEDHDVLAIMRQSIERHRLASDFYTTGGTIYNQLKVRWEYKLNGIEFNLKGMLDRLMIFPEKKLVRIYDVKTTSKTRHGFRYYIPIYNYDTQAIMYVNAAKALLAEAGHDPEEWTIEYRWMVVQTNGLNEAWCVELDPSGYDDLNKKVNKILADIHWHQTNGDWSDTRAALEAEGFETYTPEDNEQ